MQGYLAAYIEGGYKQLSEIVKPSGSQENINEQNGEHLTIHSAVSSKATNSQNIHVDKDAMTYAIKLSC